MIRHLAYYWVDLFRFSQLPYERTRLLLSEVVGLQHLERAAAAGRGVVLLTAHLGNWELGSVFLREQNLPLSVVYVRDQSPSAEAFRGFLRGCLEVEEIALDPRGQLSSLPVLRALQAGRVVAMQGDRDLNDRGDWFPFFGRPAPFPTGPMEVARLTGAQLVPVFVVYDEDYRFRLEFGEPIEVSGTGDRRQEVRRAQGRWVELLERAVARWPDQWYTFFDFWRQRERGLPVPVAAPDDRSEVERQTGARPNDDSREEAPRKETLRKEAM